MDDKKFSLDNFKKWMSDYKFDFAASIPKDSKLVGKYVESKINSRKLVEKITVKNGDEKEIEILAKEFKKHGGTVIEAYQDDMLLIETDAGSFTLHKFFIKKEKTNY